MPLCPTCLSMQSLGAISVKFITKWQEMALRAKINGAIYQLTVDFLGVINQIIERIGYKKRGAFAPLEGRVIMRQVWGG